ncbi:MAG: thioredoxin domain-containing protein [Alphaproteobacteria bacterium]
MVRRTLRVFAVAALLSLLAVPGWGQSDAGYEAYKRGDYAAAHRVWESLAEGGDASAQYNLGLLYHYGLGVERYRVTAAKWYVRAAEGGNAEAQKAVGDLYMEGFWGKRDYAKAAQWYEFAAQQGQIEAQRKLGVLLADGKGVPRDIDLARSWLQIAADQGDAVAQKRLNKLKPRRQVKRQVKRRARRKPSRSGGRNEMRVDGAPYKGAADAPVTLIEFSDYQCPFCRRHSYKVAPRIVKNFVSTGKVKYVMREYPIASLHPDAAKASEGALCAGDQEKYWEMHDLIIANPRRVGPGRLKAHARRLGLDEADFGNCLDGGQHAGTINADTAVGYAAGVRGTPSFFIGLTDPRDTDRVTSLTYIRGAKDYDVFKRAIEAALSSAP